MHIPPVVHRQSSTAEALTSRVTASTSTTSPSSNIGDRLATHQVLPMYMAVDTSSSMSFRLNSVERAIFRMREELIVSPLLGEKTRIAILEFSDRANLLLPLSDLTELRTIPRLHSSGSTRFGPLFRLLSRIIEQDLRVLHARATVSYRPFIFLIIDSDPVDDWIKSYDAFTSKVHPNLITIALGKVGKSTMRRLHPTMIADFQNVSDGQELELKLFNIFNEYAQSLTNSTMRRTARGDVRYPEIRTLDEPFDDTDLW